MDGGISETKAAALEAAQRVPQTIAAGRGAKREAAQALINASGYQAKVQDFETLIKLARQQGSVSEAPRGACKICGGLGHLTRQCKNYLSDYFGTEDLEVDPDAMPTKINQFSSSDSDSDSDTDSTGSKASELSGQKRKRRRKEKEKEKRRKKRRKKESKKSKKEKKRSKHKSRKHEKE